MQKIWFTSDTHFGHKNVLKHCPERLKAFGIPEDVTDEEKVRLHDEYLIQLWNGTIGRKDIVYIIGDFSFYNVEKTRKILSRRQLHLLEETSLLNSLTRTILI